MNPSQVIIRPVVSEKTYVLAEAGKYTFRVADVVGAASLLISEAALAEMTARAVGQADGDGEAEADEEAE